MRATPRNRRPVRPGGLPHHQDGVAASLEAIRDGTDDDPGAIAQALGAVARSGNSARSRGGPGLLREGLYKALSAHGNLGLATVIKVSHALGPRLRLEAAG